MVPFTYSDVPSDVYLKQMFSSPKMYKSQCMESYLTMSCIYTFHYILHATHIPKIKDMQCAVCMCSLCAYQYITHTLMMRDSYTWVAFLAFPYLPHVNTCTHLHIITPVRHTCENGSLGNIPRVNMYAWKCLLTLLS